MEFEQFIEILENQCSSDSSVQHEAEHSYHEFVDSEPGLAANYLFQILENPGNQQMFSMAIVLIGVFFRNVPSDAFEEDAIGHFFEVLFQVFVNETIPPNIRQSIGYSIIMLNRLTNGESPANNFFIENSLNANEDVSLEAMDCIILSFRMKLLNFEKYRENIEQFFASAFQEGVSVNVQIKAMSIVFISSKFVNYGELNKTLLQMLNNLEGEYIIKLIDNINEFFEHMIDFVSSDLNDVMTIVLSLLEKDIDLEIKKSATTLVGTIITSLSKDALGVLGDAIKALISECKGLEEINPTVENYDDNSLFGTVKDVLSDIFNVYSASVDAHDCIWDIIAELEATEDTDLLIMFAYLIDVASHEFYTVHTYSYITEYIDKLFEMIGSESAVIQFYGLKAINSMLSSLRSLIEISYETDEFKEKLEELDFVSSIFAIISPETDAPFIKYVIKILLKLDYLYTDAMKPTFGDQIELLNAALGYESLIPVVIKGYNFFVAKDYHEAFETIIGELETIIEEKEQHGLTIFFDAFKLYVKIFVAQPDEYITENFQAIADAINGIDFNDLTDDDIYMITDIFMILNKRSRDLSDHVIEHIMEMYLEIIKTPLELLILDMKTQENQLLKYKYFRDTERNQIIAYPKDISEKINSVLKNICILIHNQLIPNELFDQLIESVKANFLGIMITSIKDCCAYILCNIILQSERSDEVSLLIDALTEITSNPDPSCSKTVKLATKCVDLVFSRNDVECENINNLIGNAIMLLRNSEYIVFKIKTTRDIVCDDEKLSDLKDFAKKLFALVRIFVKYFPGNFVEVFQDIQGKGLLKLGMAVTESEILTTKTIALLYSLHAMLVLDSPINNDLFEHLDKMAQNNICAFNSDVVPCTLLMEENLEIDFSEKIYQILMQSFNYLTEESIEYYFTALPAFALFIVRFRESFDVSLFVDIIDRSMPDAISKLVKLDGISMKKAAYVTLAYVLAHENSAEPYTRQIQSIVQSLSQSVYADYPFCSQLIAIFTQ